MLEEVLDEAGRQEGVVVDEVKAYEPCDEDDEDDEDQSVHSAAGGERILYARSYAFFFGRLLDKERIWNRPPHNHCERCAQFEKCMNRIRELNPALLTTMDDPEHAKHAAVINRSGGAGKSR